MLTYVHLRSIKYFLPLQDKYVNVKDAFLTFENHNRSESQSVWFMRSPAFFTVSSENGCVNFRSSLLLPSSPALKVRVESSWNDLEIFIFTGWRSKGWGHNKEVKS